MTALLLPLLSHPALGSFLQNFIPLHIFMRLLLACKWPGATAALQVSMARQQQHLYNYVIESVHPALLRGVYCPGLDCIARGFLLVDGACGMLESELLRQLHLSPRDERPLGPLVATFAAPGDDAVMAAWHSWNEATSVWLGLWGFLQDTNTQVTRFSYYIPAAPTALPTFLAAVVHGNFRFAIVFQSQKPDIIEID